MRCCQLCTENSIQLSDFRDLRSDPTVLASLGTQEQSEKGSDAIATADGPVLLKMPADNGSFRFVGWSRFDGAVKPPGSRISSDFIAACAPAGGVADPAAVVSRHLLIERSNAAGGRSRSARRRRVPFQWERKRDRRDEWR